MWEKLKTLFVEQVVWAETNMKGKTGKEKRDALVQKLDDMIVLPGVLELFDGPIIGFFVDMAVSKLNGIVGHGFGAAGLTEEQEKTIANSIQVPTAMAAVLKDAVIKGVL